MLSTLKGCLNVSKTAIANHGCTGRTVVACERQVHPTFGPGFLFMTVRIRAAFYTTLIAGVCYGYVFSHFSLLSVWIRTAKSRRNPEGLLE